MANTNTLRCDLITPENRVLECDAVSVSLPAHDGSIGFLKSRAPLLCKLGVGTLEIDTGSTRRRYYVDGGFAQMFDNTLTILTEQAVESSDIDLAAADAELREAQAQTAADADARAEKDAAVSRAKAKKRIAERT